jgi:hypothetical protein
MYAVDREAFGDLPNFTRAFFSKALDGLGTQPDAKYSGLDPALRDVLTVGRSIAEV